jgi:hypothetical protein
VRCASVENEALLKSKYPDRETTQQFENWISQKIQENNNNSNKNISAIITIPVVVHILSNGDAIGTNENLVDGRVFSQIQSLNQDFRRMLGTPGYNDSDVGADTEIEFCLAQRKPDGTATNGIDRVITSTASFSTRPDVEAMKATTQWDPLQYFNIWVVNFSGSLNLLLGYAQFPSTSGLSGLNTNGGAANTDGVVISYTSFGNQAIFSGGPYDGTYNKGRTTTHEIGHALGLRHIWVMEMVTIKQKLLIVMPLIFVMILLLRDIYIMDVNLEATVVLMILDKLIWLRTIWIIVMIHV